MMNETFVHPSSEIENNTYIGKGTKIWNWTKIREGAKIGANCTIGQCAYIDKNVRIGDNCKIQNGVSVYTGVLVGNNVLIGPNVTFTNDRNPRAHNQNWTLSETIIEDGASIGANATIVCGIKLGKHCMIAAGAIVTKDVPAHALMLGQPARIVDYVNLDGQPIKWDILSKSIPTETQLLERLK